MKEFVQMVQYFAIPFPNTSVAFLKLFSFSVITKWSLNEYIQNMRAKHKTMLYVTIDTWYMLLPSSSIFRFSCWTFVVNYIFNRVFKWTNFGIFQSLYSWRLYKGKVLCSFLGKLYRIKGNCEKVCTVANLQP